MFKLAITAGHYRYTAGKRCMKKLDPNQTREWVLNSRIVEKIEVLLKEYEGIEILRTDDRTGETDVTLRKRTDKANDFGADFYLSIHHNAGINGGSGGGIVAYVYTKPGDVSLAWQKDLYNALIAKTGLKGNRSNPLPKKNLHECRETKMPAVLIECGFMDSKTDVPIILTEDYANKCAEAIVSVIVNRAKLKKKAEGVKPTPEPKPEVTFKVGDKVKMATGATVYGKTTKFSSWVYKSTLYVRQISGDRAVVSTQKTGAVTGAVDKKYLSLM